MTQPNDLTALAQACERAAEELALKCLNCYEHPENMPFCGSCQQREIDATTLSAHAAAIRAGRGLMCIVCRCGDRGDEFLDAFVRAQIAMREATDAMHRCAETERAYDRTHKAMVRLVRAWNRLEQEREHGTGPAALGGDDA